MLLYVNSTWQYHCNSVHSLILLYIELENFVEDGSEYRYRSFYS